MGQQFSYSEEQLRAAIGSSVSWRGVLRALGLHATSAGAIRSVRGRAEAAGIGFDHFASQRGWTEDELRSAIASADNWEDVSAALGVASSPHDLARLDAHAARLKLRVEHLGGRTVPHTAQRGLVPDLAHLSSAGSLMAASWFTLCGMEVSWPLEPARYDLVTGDERGLRRVQVKTTTVRVGDSWKVYLSTTQGARRTYALSEIDDFFVIDGDLSFYLIPIEVVGGLQAIHLRAYSDYQLSRPSWPLVGDRAAA